jgi:hypothetical protein
MKKILIGFLALLVILGAVFGTYYLVDWMSTPRYMVLEKTKSLSINSNVIDFAIAPGKVRLTNIWNRKSAIIPITIINGDGISKYRISNYTPTKLEQGYVDASTLDNLKFSLKDTIVTVSSNSSMVVNVDVSKIAGGKLVKQEKWIAVELLPGTESATLKIVRTYIFKILVN